MLVLTCYCMILLLHFHSNMTKLYVIEYNTETYEQLVWGVHPVTTWGEWELFGNLATITTHA